MFLEMCNKFNKKTWVCSGTVFFMLIYSLFFSKLFRVTVHIFIIFLNMLSLFDISVSFQDILYLKKKLAFRYLLEKCIINLIVFATLQFVFWLRF
jgi:hypothetical protein